jgi:hypothetical protein
MRTVNRTFSIDVDVDRDLHFFVKDRSMSRFVSETIRKSLKEKSDKLLKEYAMANEDEGQKEARHDWDTTIADGLVEDNDW